MPKNLHPRAKRDDNDDDDVGHSEATTSSPQDGTSITSSRSNPRGVDATINIERNPSVKKRRRESDTIQRTPNDVLCGRGIPIQNYHGNIRLHRILDSFREEYLATNRRDKPDLIRRIIAKIKEGGARFLKRKSLFENESDDPWEEMDDSYAYEKVSHALRCRRYVDNTIDDDEPTVHAVASQLVVPLDMTLPHASQIRVASPPSFPCSSIGKGDPRKAKSSVGIDVPHYTPRRSLLELERQLNMTFPRHIGNHTTRANGSSPVQLHSTLHRPPPTQTVGSNPNTADGLINLPSPMLNQSLPSDLSSQSALLFQTASTATPPVVGVNSAIMCDRYRQLQADPCRNYSSNDGDIHNVFLLNLQNEANRFWQQQQGVLIRALCDRNAAFGMGELAPSVQNLLQMQYQHQQYLPFSLAQPSPPNQSQRVPFSISTSLAPLLPTSTMHEVSADAPPTGSSYTRVHPSSPPLNFWGPGGRRQQLQNTFWRDQARFLGQTSSHNSFMEESKQEGHRNHQSPPNDEGGRTE